MLPAEKTVEDMKKYIDRGLYVTHFNYTLAVPPHDLIITGLTRVGKFLIENGEIRIPVEMCVLRRVKLKFCRI
jgi:predicted Zn-dependent protease